MATQINSCKDNYLNLKTLLSFPHIVNIIKKMNLQYTKEEDLEIIKEIGMDEKGQIELDNLIEISKTNRYTSKYAEFYGNILNLFITPSERILKILEDCQEKLKEINQNILVKELDWVMKKIQDDEIYKLNLDVINENLKFDYDLSSNKSNNDSYGLENTIKFLNEFCIDDFTKNKKEDLKTIKIQHSTRTLNEKVRKSHSSLHNINFKLVSRYSAEDLSKNICFSPNIIHKRSDFDREPIDINEFKEENDYHSMNSNKESIDYNSSINKSLYDEPVNLNDFKLLKSESSNNNNQIVFTNGISCFTNIDLINNINFNIFDYIKSVGRDAIFNNISNNIFESFSLFSVVNYQRFQTFLNKIRVGYDYLLPYHNDIHAMDVLQTSNVFANLLNLQVSLDLTPLDLASFFTACIIHDFKHPGLGNAYLINKRSPIAIRYNDISVLENYHVSSAFKVMSHQNSNIFCDLSKEEYRVARKRIVECVLATDMAKHSKTHSSLKLKIDKIASKSSNVNVLSSFVENSGEDKKFDLQQEILCFLVHMSDISNAGKPFGVSKIWSDMITEEFFNQGEIEKSENTPYSYLCDRNNTNVPNSQIMWISNIVIPCYKVLEQISPKCKVFLDNMYDNIKEWKKLEDEK